MYGFRRPSRLEVWSLIAATVGWTRIAMRTPRLTMIASAAPLPTDHAGHDRGRVRTGRLAAADQVDHEDREEADPDRAPQDVDRQPVGVEVEQLAQAERLGRATVDACVRRAVIARRSVHPPSLRAATRRSSGRSRSYAVDVTTPSRAVMFRSGGDQSADVEADRRVDPDEPAVVGARAPRTGRASGRASRSRSRRAGSGRAGT